MCKLLNDRLDYLVVGEHWFTEQARYLRDRRVVASTKDTRAVDALTRGQGGIYLMATREAQTRITEVTVGDSFIKFCVDRTITVSGVYLPPRMDDETLQDELEKMIGSTVIFGDINTKFPRIQSGLRERAWKTGPSGRVAIFKDLQVSDSYLRLQPVPSCKLLEGVDHCFIRREYQRFSSLDLLCADKHGLDTDHRYAMEVRIDAKCSSDNGNLDGTRVEQDVLPRYRLAQLKSDDYCQRLILCFEQQLQHSLPCLSGGKNTEDPDEIDEAFSNALSAACTSVLGIATNSRRGGNNFPTKKFQERNKKDTEMIDSLEEGPSATELYKRVCLDSRENGMIVPTDAAAASGKTAMEENVAILRSRWQEQSDSSIPVPQRNGRLHPTLTEIFPSVQLVGKEEVIAGIRAQQLETSCGDDGLHIRVFSTMSKSEMFIDILLKLFNCCLLTGRMPRGWHSTVVHLISKGVEKPRDANNLRPITLSRMTRRLFERMVLHRFDPEGFGRLHPAQGGFRKHSSTYVLAAAAHHMLSTQMRRVAVFLDFEAAFDVVDLKILKKKLVSRGFPRYLLAIVDSLMLNGDNSSRVVVNGAMSDWIVRTRGLLQGSVLSPYLFNIYVDDLITRLNAQSSVPVCLFYADDGLLLTESFQEAQKLLDQVIEWSGANKQRLKIDKCAVVSSLPAQQDQEIKIEGECLPRLEEYRYLGFPMGPNGINFEKHMVGRLASAVGCSRWLMMHAESWTVAQRLQVYHIYLAPRFEYGAPLVSAWIQSMPQSSGAKLVKKLTDSGWSALIKWITSADARPTKKADHQTPNIYGLLSIATRFSVLKAAFQLPLTLLPADSPLKVLMLGGDQQTRSHSFLGCLMHDTRYLRITSALEERWSVVTKTALQSQLQEESWSLLMKESKRGLMTRMIPRTSRGISSLGRCDKVLSVSNGRWQQLFVSWRRNCFMVRQRCRCGELYLRNHHERHRCMPGLARLDRAQFAAKAIMQTELDIPVSTGTSRSRFGDVDYLLNSGNWAKAAEILLGIQASIKDYQKEQL